MGQGDEEVQDGNDEGDDDLVNVATFLKYTNEHRKRVGTSMYVTQFWIIVYPFSRFKAYTVSSENP